MKWNKYTLKINADAEDIVSATLAEVGVQSVEIEDKKPLTGEELKGMFVDIAPSFPVDDNIAYMHFYMDPDEDNEEILEAARRELDSLREFTDIGEAVITRSETEDKDWINNWKEYFHHFYVDDILIVPSWEEIPEGDEDKMILHIDPGTAFGTGMHETTQLCIRQLKKYVKPGDKILDVGTGSGILAIVSLMYGIKEAVGTDLDPCAVEAVRENMEVNGVNADQFEMMIGNIISDPEIQDRVGYERYDIVVANILAEVLLPLTPVVKKCLKPGGIYITSGIIAEKEQLVVDAVKAAGMEVLEVTRQNEWVSVTARR